MMIKVKDKKTGIVRTITAKAYGALGPRIYEKLGFVNDDGTEVGVESLPNQNTTQVTRSVKGAAPVVVKSQLVQPEAKEPAPVVEGKVPARRGPKPGSKKSISSKSTADEK